MRKIEAKIYSHLSLKDGTLNDVNEVAASEPLEIKTYNELVEIVAQLSFYNKDFLLFYRGQSNDSKNRKNSSTHYPSIYRSKNNENLTNDILNYNLNTLEKASKKLISEFEQQNIRSISELKMRKYIQWGILQHYEVCDTPLLDLTQSIRVACSFAFADNNSREGYFFVFGLPYITNRISRNSEHDIVNIRLINICPPEALRAHFQEGYLVATEDEISETDERYNFDFKRRLIAKFKIFDNNKFWKDERSMESSLKPKNDLIEKICIKIKKEIEIEMLAASYFPGKWVNTFEFINSTTHKEYVEIVDGNKYFANDKYYFDIDLVEFNNGQLKFRKNGVNNDKRKILCILTKINESTYEGVETGNKAGDAKVKYQRIE